MGLPWKILGVVILIPTWFMPMTWWQGCLVRMPQILVRPLMAMAMTVFMLSLTGVPLTAGFVGKFMIFASALQAGLFGLAVIGVLTSVVSAFYYVRVIVNMYLRDGSGDLQPALETPYVRWAINIALAGTLIFGIFYPLATNLVGMVSIA